MHEDKKDKKRTGGAITDYNRIEHIDKTGPAGALCSHCGLCMTSYAGLAPEACAFLYPQITKMEKVIHGRVREPDNPDHQYFGIYRFMKTARMTRPIKNAQWTGIISSIACEMLGRGMVDGVICVHNAADSPLKPEPFLARTREEVLAGRGNKPMLSPNLSLLDRAQQEGVRRLLFIGVGCHIQALRSIRNRLDFQKIYVLGLPCADNSTPDGLRQSLRLTSSSPDTVVKFEFMQDYYIHFIHKNSSVEKVSFFTLKPQKLIGFIHTSCKNCFDYVNSLADLVVGYMGSPFDWQWVIVRNDMGREMLDLIHNQMTFQPLQSQGNRRRISQMMIHIFNYNLFLPAWAAGIMGAIAHKTSPKGLEFARLSIDMHFIRNYLYLKRNYPEHIKKLIPEYANKILAQYRMPE